MELQTGTPQETGLCPDRIEKLDRTLAGWVREGITPSIVALVARHGKIVMHRAYGVLDSAAGGPALETDAVFPLASLTKPVTAACAMLLVDDGIIDPFHPVKKFIPEFTGPHKDEILIHHLLTHTSGIDHETIYRFSWDNKDTFTFPPCPPDQHPELHRFVWLAITLPQHNPPGEAMQYGGIGLELLAEIIRRVSGKSLAQLAAERLFKPLGMRDSFYIVPDHNIPRIIKRKDTDPNGEWLNNPECLKRPSAAAGMYATALDMAVFSQTLLNKGRYNGQQIFSPRCVELMTRDQIPGIKAFWKGQVFPWGSWSYGWNVRGLKTDDAGCYRSAEAFSHGGAGGVFLLVDPVYDLTAAYFAVDVEHPVKGLNYNKNLFTNLVIAAVMDSN